MDLDDPGGDPVGDTTLDAAQHAALVAFDTASVSDAFPCVDGVAAKAGLTPPDLLRSLAVPETLTLDSGVEANTNFVVDLSKIIATLDVLPPDALPGLLALLAEQHFRAYASDPAGVRRILAVSAAALAPDRPADDPDAASENDLRDAFRAATTESYEQMTGVFAAMYEQMLDAWRHKPRAPVQYPQIATIFTALIEGLLLRYATDDAMDIDTAVHLAGIGIRAFMIAMTADHDDDRNVEELMRDTLGSSNPPPAE